MDKKLAGRIKQFPEEILRIQDALQDILNKISASTKSGDDMQLRLIMPRLRYLKSMIDALRSDMNNVLAQIGEADSVTKQIVMQQILTLESLDGQLSGITDTISTSLKTLDESDKRVLMAEIIKRCRDLEAAAKELK
ncbi:MAG: hypothetical protein J5802_06780 [Butyrivibrio sp.]|nr:hypothetical protein [Butyrivibrio sp.]